MREATGNAAAPAARVKNVRRGNVMMAPPALRTDADVHSGNRLRLTYRGEEAGNATSWPAATWTPSVRAATGRGWNLPFLRDHSVRRSLVAHRYTSRRWPTVTTSTTNRSSSIAATIR